MPLSIFSLLCCHVQIQNGGQGVRTTLKNPENIGFPSNTGPDLLKNHCYQVSNQCWAIIGTLAKRHLMAFRWQADDGPLIVELGSSLPTSTKKKKLDPLSQNFLDPSMAVDLVNLAGLMVNLE